MWHESNSRAERSLEEESAEGMECRVQAGLAPVSEGFIRDVRQGGAGIWGNRGTGTGRWEDTRQWAATEWW